MADENRAQADRLIQALSEKAYTFDFYQAVRRLECARPDKPRVGCAALPDQDIVRFCQHITMAFAPCSVYHYKSADETHLQQLSIEFLGLLGPNGPLPLYMTEYVRNRLRNEADPTLAAFLDIFNHRVISLFYRAWAVNQKTVSFDRPDDDRFASYIASLFGIGQDSLLNRDEIEDNSKLYYSGHLASLTKHPGGLQGVLNEYFGIPIRIEEFVGQWIPLPSETLCFMGKSESTGQLGRTLIVGSKVWECQQKFRVRVGPMMLDQYTRLLPGSKSLKKMVTWIYNYTGYELGWEIQLILKADQVPQTSLGKAGKLGYTTWLKTKEFTKDPDQLMIREESYNAA